MVFGERSRTYGSLRASALGLGLVGASLLAAAPAQAETDQEAVSKAREMYMEGISAEKAEHWEDALERFKAVALIKASPGVRYHIGLCQEKLGKFVDALGTYRVAQRAAAEAGAKDIERLSTQALADLEPRIPKLVIKRGEGARAAEVSLDKKTLGATSIGKELQVDVGPHVLIATASDREPFKAEFDLAESEQRTISLDLKPLAPTPAAAPPASAEGESEPDPDAEPAAAPEEPAGKKEPAPSKPKPLLPKKGPPPEEPPAAPPPADPATSGKAITGYSFLGGGVLGLSLAGVFYSKRSSAMSDQEACAKPGSACSQGKIDEIQSRGQSASTWLSISGVTGVLSLGAGGYFLWSAYSSHAAAPTVSLVPLGQGAALLGRF